MSSGHFSSGYGSYGGSAYPYYPNPYLPKVLIGRERGIIYRFPSSVGMEIAFDIRWGWPQIMLWLRIVTESSYNEWLAGQKKQVDTWLQAYGKGYLFGRFLPPALGPTSWVVLVNPIESTWPLGMGESIEVSAKVVNIPLTPV